LLASAQDLNTRFDDIAKARVNSKQFMGNVLLGKGDQVLFEKSYGLADMEWNVMEEGFKASIPNLLTGQTSR
jgi:hypothetical protein